MSATRVPSYPCSANASAAARSSRSRVSVAVTPATRPIKQLKNHSFISSRGPRGGLRPSPRRRSAGAEGSGGLQQRVGGVGLLDGGAHLDGRGGPGRQRHRHERVAGNGAGETDRGEAVRL